MGQRQRKSGRAQVWGCDIPEVGDIGEDGEYGWAAGFGGTLLDKVRGQKELGPPAPRGTDLSTGGLKRQPTYLAHPKA